jgi:ATP-dependent exoDNAse (exonuclease V) alpha subunit
MTPAAHAVIIVIVGARRQSGLRYLRTALERCRSVRSPQGRAAGPRGRFAFPREISETQGLELARDFVRAEFVGLGMIADLNVHWDMAEDGMPKPHAHVMLSMRAVDENGFGKKVRDWNRTEMVERWREHWAELVNGRLAELDIDARIDHRSLEAQGIALEPQSQIGAPDRGSGHRRRRR